VTFLLVSGKNKNIKALFMDLALMSREKVSEFINTFHDSPDMSRMIESMYSVKIAIVVTDN